MENAAEGGYERGINSRVEWNLQSSMNQIFMKEWTPLFSNEYRMLHIGIISILIAGMQ